MFIHVYKNLLAKTTSATIHFRASNDVKAVSHHRGTVLQKVFYLWKLVWLIIPAQHAAEGIYM